VTGAISLINAKIHGDFDCTRASLHFPGEELLVADGMVVDGTTFLSHTRVSGLLRFAHSNLKDGLYADWMIFDTRPQLGDWFGSDNVSRRELDRDARGIYARQATVGGNFRWENSCKFPRAQAAGTTNYWLYLEGSKTDIVRDDEKSWKGLDYFNVNGCSYTRFAELSDHTWRLRELDRIYADPTLNIKPRRTAFWALWNACARVKGWRYCPFGHPPEYKPVADAVLSFKPQPYLQLARAYRTAGYEKTANDILTHFQRNKTRYGDLGISRQIGRWFVDIFVQYGFAPFRPLSILVFWAFVSATVFQLAYNDGKILPIKDLQQTRPRFNALLYAVDTLVPFVDFNQKKSWAVEVIGNPTPFVRPPAPPSAPAPTPMNLPLSIGAHWAALEEVFGELPGRGASFFVVFNTFFGWLMTSFLIAGVGGLLRSGREEG
jgi:hypothetical protein